MRPFEVATNGVTHVSAFAGGRPPKWMPSMGAGGGTPSTSFAEAVPAMRAANVSARAKRAIVPPVLAARSPLGRSIGSGVPQAEVGIGALDRQTPAKASGPVLGPPDGRRRSGRAPRHLDPGRDSPAELRDVGDDADHAPLAAERFEHADGLVERLVVERAKALVHEEGVEPPSAAAPEDDVGEAERQREAREEALAPGEGGDS